MIAAAAMAGLLGFYAVPEQEAVRTFRQRVDAYVKLRKDAAGKLPKLSKAATPEQIQQHDSAMLAAMQSARKGAKPGDIFRPEVRPLFLSVLESLFRGEKREKVKASIEEGNPTGEKAPGEVTPNVAVNAAYPKNAPLSTVPPTLLLRLPELPKDLDYRFVGHTLILRDAQANMIVDYMRGAVPGP